MKLELSLAESDIVLVSLIFSNACCKISCTSSSVSFAMYVRLSTFHTTHKHHSPVFIFRSSLTVISPLLPRRQLCCIVIVESKALDDSRQLRVTLEGSCSRTAPDGDRIGATLLKGHKRGEFLLGGEVSPSPLSLGLGDRPSLPPEVEIHDRAPTKNPGTGNSS